MTTKDFKIIADILIAHQTCATPEDMNSLVRQACTVLQKTNPHFNAVRFITYIKKQA